MEPVDHIIQFFAFAHLPPHLQAVSMPFCVAATGMRDEPIDPARFAELQIAIAALPANPERDVAAAKVDEAVQATDRLGQLRKLLEAKDAAVRALVAKP